MSCINRNRFSQTETLKIKSNMIAGAHVTLFSKDTVADRAFFKDVLKLPCIDAGGGWLVFGLPRLTLGFNEGKCDSDNTVDHDFLLQVPDVDVFMKEMKEQFDIDCDEPTNEPWGLITKFKLPGGSDLQVYQPSHSFPIIGE